MTDKAPLYECPFCQMRSLADEIIANDNRCPGCDAKYVYTWKSI